MKKFKLSMWLDAGFHHEKECFFEVGDGATPEVVQETAFNISQEWADQQIKVGFVYEPVLTAPAPVPDK